MSQAILRRRRGGGRKGRISDRLWAEVAVYIGAGMSKAEAAREAGMARESIRRKSLGEDRELFQRWCEIAARRVQARVPFSRIVGELLDTPEFEAHHERPGCSYSELRATLISGLEALNVRRLKRGEQPYTASPAALDALVEHRLGAAPETDEARAKFILVDLIACPKGVDLASVVHRPAQKTPR